jgi:hypothetical protein
MSNVVTEKPICENCAADVRPDTQFCYNCGKPVAGYTETADASNVDDGLAALERALAADRPSVSEPRSKIETAAEARRRSRKGKRKTVEIVWEPASSEPNRVYLLFVILIVVLAGAVFFATVFSR